MKGWGCYEAVEVSLVTGCFTNREVVLGRVHKEYLERGDCAMNMQHCSLEDHSDVLEWQH